MLLSENHLFDEPQSTEDDSDEDDVTKGKRDSSATLASSDGEGLTNKDQEHIRSMCERIMQEASSRSARFSFRRASTVSVPMNGFVLKNDLQLRDSNEERSSLQLKRSKSWAGWPQREAALEAMENRQVRFRFSTTAATRDIVCDQDSPCLGEFPEQCIMTAPMDMQLGTVWRHMTVQVDHNGVNCERVSLFRKINKAICIAKDDLIAASLTPGSTTSVDVEYMLPGRGNEEHQLMRRYCTKTMRFSDEATASKFVTSVRLYVKWMARVPEHVTRRIKVVVNPHSGRRRGRQVWEHWRPLLERAGIQCDVEETQYSGHARDIGAKFDLDLKYEAIVFVGGDGTVNEFINGVFSREESVWRTLVATTPVSLICAGTDNAFGKGVGTPTHASAVYCIIKRKIRPLDVLACETSHEDGTTLLEFACTGVSYGIGSDIAVESEATRWLNVHRYTYLKIKRGLIAPHKHEAKLSYVLSDTIPVNPETGKQILRTYYEILNETEDGPHRAERCSIYDDSEVSAKQWKGDAEQIFHPAREEKYAGKWQSITSELTSAGGSNVYFEAKYSHPSDGNIDLIYSRKGNLIQTAKVAARYLNKTFLKSELVGYYKVKALVIEPIVEDVLNVDGEVLAGPGPFRIEVVPQLLRVLSEK